MPEPWYLQNQWWVKSDLHEPQRLEMMNKHYVYRYSLIVNRWMALLTEEDGSNRPTPCRTLYGQFFVQGLSFSAGSLSSQMTLTPDTWCLTPDTWILKPSEVPEREQWHPATNPCWISPAHPASLLPLRETESFMQNQCINQCRYWPCLWEDGSNRPTIALIRIPPLRIIVYC